MESLNDKSNRRVLIVDDNHAIHDDFRKILGEGRKGANRLDEAEAALFGEPLNRTTRLAFDIDSAMQGQEGLERVQQALQAGRPYAMAFIDVRMPPGWDGIETTANIWKIDPDLQVVICTAYSDYSWDEMIAKVGHSDRLVILKKPFDNVEVLQLANALTEKWRLGRQAQLKIEDLERMVRERTQELQGSLNAQKEAGEERARMEIQLRHAQKMESIGQLAAGIAHEINTPTQYIGDNTRFLRDAFAELLNVMAVQDNLLAAARQGGITPQLIEQAEAAIQSADLAYLSEEIPKAIGQSLDGLERVAKIVLAMKEFSHPGTDTKVALDLNRSIESTLTVCRSEWKFVADVVTEFDPNLPPVPCLPGEINQTVLNIVVNATHAIADALGEAGGGKGTITVSTRRDGDWAEIRIRDTGSGIPETARARIFDPFFTTKGVGKGTGQGLAIAHSVVVDKHGGTIHFETELGRGTTFVIRLPIGPTTVTHFQEAA